MILDYLSKIVIAVVIVAVLVTLISKYNGIENFSSVKVKSNIQIDKIIKSININNLRYGYKYDIINVNELSFKIHQLVKEDPKLLELIESITIKIYGELDSNDKLKHFLEFNNLINSKGLPIFINENKENLLINQIKILLVTMPEKEFNMINLL